MIYEDERRKLWQYICHAPDDVSPVGNVVLRGDDGITRIVPAADLGDSTKPYRLVHGKSLEQLSDVLRELLQNCRNASNLRFLALPVFFTATAVLAKEYNDNPLLADRDLIPFVGFGLSLGFLAFETVLSYYLISWWKSIKSRTKGTAWGAVSAHRNELILWIGRLAVLSPYPFATAYWVRTLCWPWPSTHNLLLDTLLLALPPIVLWSYKSYISRP